MQLKDRMFKIGTWNLRGKSFTKKGHSPVNKVSLAESIMSVKGIDLLVITKPHTDDESPLVTSWSHVVLAQTGISQS